MRFKRSLRVSELIKREVSAIIMFTMKDPWVKSVIITFVKVSDDLKYARIYYRVMGGDDQTREQALQGLERAKKFIRTEIGHRTDLRFVPEIEFYYDEGIDSAERIESLLRQLRHPDNS